MRQTSKAMTYEAKVRLEFKSDYQSNYSYSIPDEPDQLHIKMESPAQDMNVNQYTSLFASFLSAISFDRQMIRRGFMSYIFRDDAPESEIRKLMDEFELVYSDKVTDLQCEIDELKKKIEELEASKPHKPSMYFSKVSSDKEPNYDTHSKYYWDIGRNRTYDQMIESGYTMSDDGFWVKEDDWGEHNNVTPEDVSKDYKQWKEFWDCK